MEGREFSQKSFGRTETSVSPEAQKRTYLLRRKDSTPISVAVSGQSQPALGSERQTLTRGSASANIYLERPLQPKSVVELPMPEGHKLYFEATEPSPQDKSRYPNSFWVERVPLDESQFKALSEERATYTLDTLPLNDKTRKTLGIEKPKVEETIPQKTKEDLKAGLRGVEGMKPTPPEEVRPESVEKIAKKIEGDTQEQFTARSGRKLNPEILEKSLKRAKEKGWGKKKEVKREPAPTPQPHLEAKGGAETLRRIERARELMNEGKVKEARRLANEIKDEMQEQRPPQRRVVSVYRVPKAAKDFIPPSQRPRTVKQEVRQPKQPKSEAALPQEKKPRKGFFASLLGR